MHSITLAQLTHATLAAAKALASYGDLYSIKKCANKKMPVLYH